jgi:hypothetical protein
LCKLRLWICIAIWSGLLAVSSGTCFANISYQESIWISLDLPQIQRRQIDQIISEQYPKVRNIQQNRAFSAIGSMGDMADLLNYMSQIQTIRTDVNDKIAGILTPEQQQIFDKQAEKNKAAADKSMLLIMSMNLTETQQLVVAKLLLANQKKAWDIIADNRTSWEERRRKLERLSTVTQITNLILASKLTTDQQAALKQWATISQY